MSWAAELLRYAVGDEPAPGAHLASHLAALQPALSANARNLAENADRAPHEAGDLALRELARQDERLADRMRTVLVELGGPVPLLQAAPPGSPAELSYWARLSEDLSRHIETHRRLQELTVAAVEVSPSLAERLQAAADEEADHIRELRGLIARADPHALN